MAILKRARNCILYLAIGLMFVSCSSATDVTQSAQSEKSWAPEGASATGIAIRTTSGHISSQGSYTGAEIAVTETSKPTSTIAQTKNPISTKSASPGHDTATQATANSSLDPTTITRESEYSIIPPVPPVEVVDPSAYLSTISIPTYDYEQAFVKTAPGDPIYPYPRLVFDQVGQPELRTYQAIVLENGFCSLTILPELGGRMYSWVDKATGRHLLYENSVVKPTNWGYRGWWLAAGGIEWAFPVEDHGLVDYQPWNYSIGSGSVTVNTIDQHTGMEVGATLSLDSGHAYVTIQPWASNNTDAPKQYQLWLNAMLTLGGNNVSPQTQFIVPANQVIVHSNGASGLPAPGNTMNWPIIGSRDMSWYGNWDGHLSFFVPGVSFVGIYDHAADQGIVRFHAPGWPTGTKIFGPATLSTSIWTDDGSNYVELWSGATVNFSSYATLEPGASVGWTERWYPISHVGGFTYANANAVLRLQDTGGGAEIGVAVSGSASGVIHLYVDKQEMANWPVTLYPGQAFRASWSRPAGLEGELGLSFMDSQSNVLAQTGQVPQ